MEDLFEILPVPSCCLNKLGLIIRANKQFHESIARPERTVNVTLLEDMLHTSDRDKLAVAFREVD